MDKQDAKSIVEAIARGENPLSGEPLPADGVLNHPKTIRALWILLADSAQVRLGLISDRSEA